MAVGAAGNVMQWLKQDSYARADLYAKPSTLKGNAFMIRAGFTRLQAPRQTRFGFMAVQGE